MAGLAVDTAECFGRTDPQDSLAIFVYRANKRFSATFRTCELRNSLEWQRVRREMGYSHPPQASPHAPFSIREHILHIVLGQAVRITGVIAVTNESSVLAVKLKQTSTVCCQPQTAVPVFGHCHDDRQGCGGRLQFVKRITG